MARKRLSLSYPPVDDTIVVGVVGVDFVGDMDLDAVFLLKRVY